MIEIKVQTYRPLLLVAALALITACTTSAGGGDTGPHRIVISGPGVVTLNPSGTHEFTVLFVDGGVDTIPLPEEVDIEWSIGDPDRASIDQSGRLEVGEMLGNVWVYARSADDQYSDSTAIWVQKPEGEPSEFKIRLVFYPGVEDRWKNALQIAAYRWEEVIRDKLPPVRTDTLINVCNEIDYPGGGEGIGESEPSIEKGVTLVVRTSNRFPEGTYVEAVGGPCMNRGLPHPTTVLGVITINVDHPVNTISSSRLRYLVHHEMGHTLGLVGVIQGYQPDWLVRENKNSLYRGHLARHGFYLKYGSEREELRFSGSAHWYYPGVMSEGASNFVELSKISIGALMDLGYPAAWYGSGLLAEVE